MTTNPDLAEAVGRLTKVREAMPSHPLHFALRSIYGREAPNAKFSADLRSLTLRAGELDEEIKDADDALTIAHSLQGFATGHGDTLTDLVLSLSIQSRDRAQAAEAALKSSQARIAELEAENERLRVGLFGGVAMSRVALERTRYGKPLNPTPKAGRTG
jgi:hypothetical protein